MRHLTDLDELREGIGLRAFAQQDPLVAYKTEAHEMYQELLASISHDIVYAIYHAQFIDAAGCAARAPDADQPRRRRRPAAAGAQRQGQLGRNDPCWCGSGKKYKQCHMRADQGRAPATVAAGAGAAWRAAAAAQQAARNASARKTAAVQTRQAQVETDLRGFAKSRRSHFPCEDMTARCCRSPANGSTSRATPI